jgi:hypothetical protein
MYSQETEEPFTAFPKQLTLEEAPRYRWSIYVVRIDLTRHDQAPALKIGMVGTRTIGERLALHAAAFGETKLRAAWTLAHEVNELADLQSWRLVEQYEARLQFAPEFDNPHSRLRRLRPDTRVYSFEWFEDDESVLNAVKRVAPLPVTLPHGWTLARADVPPERLGQNAVNRAFSQLGCVTGEELA